MVDITRLDSNSADFWQQLDKLLAWDSVSDDKVNAVCVRY